MERGHEIKVLDHGYVRLVDYMGSDEAIVEAARMSTGRGFVSWERYLRCRLCDQIRNLRDAELPCSLSELTRDHDWQDFPRGDFGLLETMYKNKHSTPFEFGTLHIEVQAPLMVFREWHRHRTWGYSEFSARYSQMPDLHYLPALSRIQRQSATNKQGSAEHMGDDYAAQICAEIKGQQEDIYATYEGWLDDGLAKEVARLNTPVSRYSKMRGIVNLRNVLAFLLLRKAPAAQWEIRQYADAVGEIVKAIWPRTYALFDEHDLHGVHLSCTEKLALADVVKQVSRSMLNEMLGDKEATALLKKLGV